MTFEEFEIRAKALGFAQCAAVRAGALEDWARYAAQNGTPGRAAHPAQVLEGARLVVVLAHTYPAYLPTPPTAMEISGYYAATQTSFSAARALADWLNQNGVPARETDALAIKRYAALAGLGAYGRNHLLLHPEFGPAVGYRLLAVNAPWAARPFSAEMPALSPLCENCARCVRACPCGALAQNPFAPQNCLRAHLLSGQAVPMDMRPQMGRKLVGCGLCQTACPRHAAAPLPPPAHWAQTLDIFALLEDYAPQRKSALAALIGPNYAGKARVQAQAAIAAGNMRDARCIPALKRAATQTGALGEHARWALERMQSR